MKNMIRRVRRKLRGRMGAQTPLSASIEANPASTDNPALFPNGHFYSPTVSMVDVRAQEARIWSAQPEVLGIDFNDGGQIALLTNVYPQFASEFDYPDEQSSHNGYFLKNDQFSNTDALTLFVLLRSLQPQRIIEIGSGFSTLLMADVNRRFFDGRIQITAIEPYPRDFLTKGVDGVARLVVEKVQNVPLSTYDELQSGDILFIDTSHVVKTGSDVNFIYFEIIPRLRPGVIIHIHDIFLPSDYPKSWVAEGRNWSEHYLIRALLMYTKGFEVIVGTAYLALVHSQLCRDVIPRFPMGGGSLWLRKLI